MANENETVEDLCSQELVSCGATELAYQIVSAHKRELAAKDAEIESWRKQALQEDDRANALLTKLHKAEALIVTLGEALEKACTGDPVMRSYFGSLIDDAKAYESGKDSAAK